MPIDYERIIHSLDNIMMKSKMKDDYIRELEDGVLGLTDNVKELKQRLADSERRLKELGVSRNWLTRFPFKRNV